jgi:Zn finger protein HypA/HybF involved in hydrogenase expression
MICCECGKRFKKAIREGTFEVRCPKCGGYDTEIDQSFLLSKDGKTGYLIKL